MAEVERVVEDALERSGGGEGWLNNAAALTVAVVASFMAIGSIKDDNIVQAMAQAQAAQIDEWSYFQAKSTKQNIAEATAEQLRAQRDLLGPGASAEAVAAITRKIDEYDARVKRYEAEKAEIRTRAEGFGRTYALLDQRDDQFDMCEALLSVAIALIGVSVLTKRTWLFFFSVALAAVGVALGLAGFASLDLHPEWLARLLT